MKKKKNSLLPILFILVIIVTFGLFRFSSCRKKTNGNDINNIIDTNDTSESTASADTPADSSADTQPTGKQDKDATEIITANTVDKLSADTVFVWSSADQTYLIQKNTDRQLIPASITKLLSCLTLLDILPEDTVVCTGDELSLVKEGSSLAFIGKGQMLRISQLVEGMLLPSGNDAAYAAAAAGGRALAKDENLPGSSAVSLFMERVNAYATEIGCTGTHFEFPDGDGSVNHYTTAHDLILIAEKALQNEVISRYTKLDQDHVTYVSGEHIVWNNTNKLIQKNNFFYTPSVTGLKTGSLDGKYSLLVSAEIKGKRYIIGIFDAPSDSDRFNDARYLIDAIEKASA